jgi:hypothetical protein
MSEEITTPDINQAWDRIARTGDGQIIYRHLQRLALALCDNVSALPVHEGGRILARNLMSLMAEGIADSDRAAVAFVTRTAERADRPRGAGRRIGPEHFVPSYDVDRTGSPYDTGSGSGSNGPGAS